MVQTVWAVRDSSEKGLPDELDQGVGSPLFLKLLRSRGFQNSAEIESYINPSLADLSNPFLMKGMREAVSRIQKARANREKVLIHGDYDVDGITGAAITSLALEKLGVSHITFLPERAKDGYGVSREAIQKAKQEGVSLLITVDCGISAGEEIREARENGIDAIVIDHHRLPPEGLPPAFAILNPLQEGCEYPFKELSAGGLAFKLAQALLDHQALELLDLATLSTIADLAPLIQENRVIVTNGLRRLSERKRVGIRVLAETASLRAREIKASHVGFVLGPRINATGRMSSALTALRLLLTENEREAASLAQILEGENRERRETERRIVAEAIDQVERSVNFSREQVLVVSQEGWHPGVIGIVAARLVERYYRPALVIALQDGKGKGSGRSIRSFNLFSALEANREFFLEFGGHAQAAGFSLLEDQVLPLRKKINEYSHASYPAEAFLKSIEIDLEINLADLTPRLIKELELLEPHGIGNPKPVFVTRGLRVKKVMSSKAAFPRSRVWVTDGILTYEVTVSERSGVSLDFEKGTAFDLVYSVKQKKWEGEEVVLLEAKDVKLRA
ncbi:MAG: single-stranded-DNA-specific exonuclease RecJ [Candidatus Omnitrophica bacterium]|nr:single-stranded-DNA-specific exonuclease RecJ [Candidatus Omnitrophota bacterium]